MGQNVINTFPNKPWFLHVCSTSLWKTLGRGETAINGQFLLFPQCFLLFLENFLQFSSNLKVSSANSFSLEDSKNLSFGKGLRNQIQQFQTHSFCRLKLLSIWISLKVCHLLKKKELIP